VTAKKRAAKKVGRRRRRAAADDGLVQLKRVDLRIALSPSNVQGLLATVEPAYEEARLSGGFSAQVRLDARDLKSIYIYLGPWQMKQLVARLKALRLGAAR
jgi:hypothetical protein